MTGTVNDPDALIATLAYAWYLGRRKTRQQSLIGPPDETAAALLLATQWSTWDPHDVGRDERFNELRIPARDTRRPFQSAALRDALIVRRSASEPSRARQMRPPLALVRQPYYLPIDLHLKFTSDLVHDGWARQTPPTMRQTRYIAARAVNAGVEGWKVKSARAVTRRLEERGQLEQWLTALDRVRLELREHPRLFGATWDDIDVFVAHFHQDNEASYPKDAAVLGFLRDHRCVNYIGKLGWSSSRVQSASAHEVMARRYGSSGPWELIEERIAEAAAIVDAACQTHAKTA